MNNEWLTAKEVASYLKVSLATVYRWTKDGILKSYRAGRTSRYKKSEVDAAMKAGPSEEPAEDLSQWTESEQARRREAEAGRAVVCHIDNDLRLKAWAEDKCLSVYIGRENKKRGMAESKWHNPSNKGGRKKMIEDFIAHYWASQHLQDSIGELKAKVLVCYCYPEACHGDFLAEQANKL